ncbi:hypothetical protein [uncultured Draconibacterium sp.]|uniref:hypothetical protein n=1 Tax=uncultured Draconibacterium sp. TaxID=1573823 RepID=UPI0025F48D94|nr:hypothetical protein [uncultured Draconibacterium sp.]
MRVYCKYIVLLFVLLLAGKWGYAQFPNEKKLTVNYSFNPIALIDIEPDINNSIQFEVIANTNSGGEPIMTNTSSASLWLNYTSVTNSETRDIKARIEGGNLPDGVKLLLSASAYKGAGKGKTGQPVGEIALSSEDQVIISGVGNCYTGDGMQNGHALDFELVLDDFSKLSAVNESILTILYTISE